MSAVPHHFLVIQTVLRDGETNYRWSDGLDDKATYPTIENPDRTPSEINDVIKIAQSKNLQIMLVWEPVNPKKICFNYRAAMLSLEEINKTGLEIYRLPLSDPRLGDNDYYHDDSHFKKSLGDAVLQKNNLVSIQSLIDELEQTPSLKFCTKNKQI